MEEMVVARLIGMMQRGTPKGKENVVVAPLELCQGGGAATTQRVARAPALGGLLLPLLLLVQSEQNAKQRHLLEFPSSVKLQPCLWEDGEAKAKDMERGKAIVNPDSAKKQKVIPYMLSNKGMTIRSSALTASASSDVDMNLRPINLSNGVLTIPTDDKKDTDSVTPSSPVEKSWNSTL
ncbi:hypothetical protein NE237_001252 [Protea cynaroides]|uniref:Uncharacterized protein n=1 Tax=Protea cynaroides TaxID=273540 RepID=A0A9Q0KTT1_9MAGN|nr:hypothetical protein NE237_001252 [Protea cynaroides]